MVGVKLIKNRHYKCLDHLEKKDRHRLQNMSRFFYFLLLIAQPRTYSDGFSLNDFDPNYDC